MNSVCDTCANELSGEYITCQGFCKAAFHPKCCGIVPNMLEAMKSNENICWLCKSCSNLMNDIRFRNSVGSAHACGNEKPLNTHTDLVKDLKSEILTELKQELRSNFTALINSSSFTPKGSQRSKPGSNSARPRQLFKKANDKQRFAKDLLCGTGESPSPSMGTLVASEVTPKFWLYLSRIASNVTVDQVRDLVKQRLNTDNVDVVLLVAKGRDLSVMSFISFKIGVSSALKDKALSTATWPKGVAFREFKNFNKSNENFWRPIPSKTPAPTGADVQNDQLSPTEEEMDE